MQSPDNKVDMAQMDAAIDKALALPPITQAELKNRRAQRKVKRPLLPEERAGANAQTAVR